MLFSISLVSEFLKHNQKQTTSAIAPWSPNGPNRMTSREKIGRIFARSADARTGFWTGDPVAETMTRYLTELGFSGRDQLFDHLHDDCRWIPVWGYQHPEGREAFDVLLGQPRTSLSQPGCFAECASLAEIEAHPWPNPTYCDFTADLARVRQHRDKAVFTGTWACFFHIAADYFGMENYFMKMHTDPEQVEAVTNHVTDFFVAANDQYFAQLGDAADYCFFGNDFGTQQSLLLSPECFKRFILPSMRRLISGAKKFNKKVMVHSCGAIREIIPLLIEAGVDGLHPLQARAAGMDAASLAREYKRDLVFMGGVDTQELLVHATPGQIKDEVRRLRDLLGPHYIVSPSHEGVLPNVPLANIVAMAEAARE